MTIEFSIFSLFSSLAVVSSILVIRCKNPVHSVLFLIFVFCNTSGLFLLLDLDFFAMVFLVVYVGAIAVLFLFVVMMLNIKAAEISENILHFMPIGGLIGLIFLLEIFLVVENDFIPVMPMILTSFPTLIYLSKLLIIGFVNNSVSLSWINLTELVGYCQEISTQKINLLNFTHWFAQWESFSNIEVLGFLLYTHYFPYFLIASLILLVAMIGSIMLTLYKNLNVRKQEILQQNAREFTKTIQKMR